MRTRKIYTLILKLASRKRQFKPSELSPPLSKNQARRNCLALSHLSLLVRVRRGHAGRQPRREPVYRKSVTIPGRQ
jgi:hypothetical protein